RWFRLPLKLMFQVGTRQEVYPVTVEGEVSRFFFRLGSRPRMVLLDPDFDCPVKKLSFDKPQDLLLHELTQAPGVVSRLEAAERLAEKPDARVVAALGKALKREKFWGVQQRIARALGRIGGAAAREALLDGLRVPHPKARREVVSVLGWFREDPQVAAALLRLVKKGDPSGYVEGEAARALGRCRAPGAAEALAALLDRDAHTDAIRVGVYDGLAELGDEAVLPLVSEGMRQGSPPLARVAAIRAAGELGWRHLRLRPNLLEALAQVAEVRDNPSASFRPKLAAIRALQRMGDLAGLPVLRRIVENETDGRVIRLAKLAIEALRRAADKPAELHSLRTDLDLVGKENKSLRERVETLEKTKGPKTPLRPGGSRRSASGKKTPRRR
ncbi:MAG: HEAT repeat domain-containing protein, partial [Deltaproteobacteria bacterium]|nr:HEAT repeat domain-containing protein [Deltaproteobacteria bacterium]